MPILPIILKFLSYFWTNFQSAKVSSNLQNSQIVRLLAQKTFLEIILVIQGLGVFSLLVALACFVRMSSANFYWFGALFFWGIPGFFQFALILRDFFWLKTDFGVSSTEKNKLKINLSSLKPIFQAALQGNQGQNSQFRLLIKKYFVVIILVNLVLYFSFWLPILRVIFDMPFSNGVFGKLGGIGEFLSFFALIWPYFGYLTLVALEYWQVCKSLAGNNLSNSQIIDANFEAIPPKENLK